MMMQKLSAQKVVAPGQSRRAAVVVRAGKYDEELIATAHTVASKGRGIL